MLNRLTKVLLKLILMRACAEMVNKSESFANTNDWMPICRLALSYKTMNDVEKGLAFCKAALKFNCLFSK